MDCGCLRKNNIYNIKMNFKNGDIELSQEIKLLNEIKELRRFFKKVLDKKHIYILRRT